MPRPTLSQPERGPARKRLLDAAVILIRRQGYTATSVGEVCAEAGVTKGAFFHHFESKEALGVASIAHWIQTNGDLFADEPWAGLPDPLDRLLGYIDFRRTLISGDPATFSCLVGTIVQEMYAASPKLRLACEAAIFGPASELATEIEAAIASRGLEAEWSATDLAHHTQAVLQGAFILAKAQGHDISAQASVDLLRRFIEMLFGLPPGARATLSGAARPSGPTAGIDRPPGVA